MKKTVMILSVLAFIANCCGQRASQEQNSGKVDSTEHSTKIKTTLRTMSDFEEWEEYQNYLKDEILKRKSNEILKESFLQEMYIRNVALVSNDSLFVTIPFNLHSFDCGAPDCYSTDVSFSFQLGDTLKFPKALPFKEHEHGCVPEEIKLSGIFQLQEQTDKHVIYHSTEHKRILVLFSNNVKGTTAYYFSESKQEKINGENIYGILEKDVDFLDSLNLFRSWVLTTNEYENFIK